MNLLSKFSLLLLLTLTFTAATAQQAKPRVMVKPIAPTPEVKAAIAAVEANPEDAKAHRTFIRSEGKDFDAMMVQYDKWIAKYPKSVTVPFSIGEFLYNRENAGAKKYLLRVTQLDPNNADTWFMLSMDAERWGLADLAAEYLKKASTTAPDKPEYTLYEILSNDRSNREEFAKKMLEFVKRFPDSDRSAQGLYWLAQDSPDNAEKVKYFEMLRALYSPLKSNWSEAGMENLWAAYLETDLAKATELSNYMGDRDVWPKLRVITELVAKERELSAKGDIKGAIATLSQVKQPRYPDISDFYFREQASLQEKAGNLKGAYDTLAVKAAKEPATKILALTMDYGKKLGKTPEQVQQDLRTLRAKSASPAFPFDLGLYTSKGKLSLKDLKGKVVLLTFWFPGCGPCRAEFPYFQHVIDKLKDKPVSYIGINVYPDQDEYVLPYMKNSGYSFTPLRGTSDEAARTYGVRGEPTNFLIDQEGKIVFRDFRIEAGNESTLENMITSLLTK